MKTAAQGCKNEEMRAQPEMQPIHQPVVGARYIWSLDCLAICTILGFALDKKTVIKLCRKSGVSPLDQKLNVAYGFYLLHHFCHEKNGYLGKQVTRLLNERYAQTIKELRAMDGEEPSAVQLAELDNRLLSCPAGVLWGLLTDGRVSFQQHGVYLVHQLAFASFRGARKVQTVRQQSDRVIQQQQKKLQTLNNKLQTRQYTQRKQQQEVERVRKELYELRRVCNHQKQQLVDYQTAPDREAQLLRRIRKLEYELDAMRREEFAEVTVCSAAIESVNECCPYEESCVLWPSTSPFEDKAITGKIEPDACDERRCPLNALRVAVVGGLDRLEPRYRQVIETMGGELFFHNGDCRGGGHILKNGVCHSDIVVFITRVKSHSALHIVKGICQKTGKYFVALRATSPQAVADVLHKFA